DWQSLRGRGRAHGELENWQPALADWTAVSERRPDLWEAWYLLGMYHSELYEQHELGVTAWTRVLQLGIDTTEVRYQRAVGAAKAGRWAEAAADISRVAEKTGRPFGLRYLHGLFALAGGQKDAYRQVCAGLQDGLAK